MHLVIALDNFLKELIDFEQTSRMQVCVANVADLECIGLYVHAQFLLPLQRNAGFSKLMPS